MGYRELVVSANHMVGTHKWIIRTTDDGKRVPVEVYLESAHIDVKPGDTRDFVLVNTKYKTTRGKYLWLIPENDIYDTKDEAVKALNDNLKYK